MLVTVNVRKSHIVRGEQDNRHECAVSLGLRSLINNDSSVETNEEVFCFGKTDDTYETPKEVAMPARVRGFVKKFDSGDTPKSSLKPFSFRLNIPDRYLKKSLLKKKK